MNEHANLATAMLAARLKLPAIPKTATNPHFKNKYAPLGSVLEIVVPIYGAEGVLLSGEGAGGLDITATHVKTGETKRVTIALVGGTDMQRLGGAYTYAARYGYGALLALELDDDDDGNKAAGKDQKAQGRATPAPAKPAAPPASAPVAQPPVDSRAADDDQEAVEFMAAALDLFNEEQGKPFRNLDGPHKIRLLGGAATRVGVPAGSYTPLELASRGKLAAVRSFYEWACKQNLIEPYPRKEAVS